MSTCPLCGSPGEPDEALLAAYQGACGTTWGDRVEPRRSPACEIIASLRVEIELVSAGVAS
jgi:hypothetical protein